MINYRYLANLNTKLCIISMLFLIIPLFLLSCGGDWKGYETGYTFVGGGSATLHWVNPDSNIDGSSSNGLVGYIVYYGNTSGHYTESIDVMNVSEYTINNLSSGTWYFALTSYNILGNESEFSNELSKDVP